MSAWRRLGAALVAFALSGQAAAAVASPCTGDMLQSAMQMDQSMPGMQHDMHAPPAPGHRSHQDCNSAAMAGTCIGCAATATVVATAQAVPAVELVGVRWSVSAPRSIVAVPDVPPPRI